MAVTLDIRKGSTREGYLAYHQILTAMYGAAVFESLKQNIPHAVEGLPENFRERLMFGLQYHDLAKHPDHGWTESLLSHKRHPTVEEWETAIIPHPEISADLLINSGIEDRVILEIARCHHVRYDGESIKGFAEVDEPEFVIKTARRVPEYSGYPAGYRGSDMGIWQRIAKLADAVSTMVESRPYQKKPKEIIDVLDEIVEDKRMGAEYCPIVAAAFWLAPREQLKRIMEARIDPAVLEADIQNRELIRRGEFRMELYVPPILPKK